MPTTTKKSFRFRKAEIEAQKTIAWPNYIPTFGTDPLPIRILRACLGNTVPMSGFDRDILQAIRTLERAASNRQGAQRSKKTLGRPPRLAALVPKIRQLLKKGSKPAQIATVLFGQASQAWIYATIRGIKAEKA